MSTIASVADAVATLDDVEAQALAGLVIAHMLRNDADALARYVEEARAVA